MMLIGLSITIRSGRIGDTTIEILHFGYIARRLLPPWSHFIKSGTFAHTIILSHLYGYKPIDAFKSDIAEARISPSLS
jgi:hypothetical protein